MSKPLKPGKQTVELQPAARASRIRRDPALADTPTTLARDAWWASSEWEVRLSIAGMIFFALAISAAVVDIAHILGV